MEIQPRRQVYFIEEEVSKLLTDKVIEPSYSPWRDRVIVDKDGRHKPRMVIDYSHTVNRYYTVHPRLYGLFGQPFSKILAG